MKLFQDGIRIGRLMIRWKWGKPGGGKVRHAVGLQASLDDFSFLVVASFWWRAAALEFWIQ